MHYRRLGKTGLNVSQLGFGAMRLPMIGEGEQQVVDREPAIAMIHRAFEGGVNYIDTAVGYCNRDSQRAVGEALRGWRDSIIVSTKNHYYDHNESQWRQHLEDSLRRLDIDCIDIYNHHGVNWKRFTEDVQPRLSNWMRRAKDEGLIRHICTSFHDDNDALKRIVDTGYVDVITLQYNLLNRSLEEGIAYADEHDIGVVVMGPVAGGRLGASSEVLESIVPNITRVPELALRFVLNNPHVDIALSGMSTLQQVEENLAIASGEVSLCGAEMQLIDEHMRRLKKMEELYCTGCGYCLPCPQNVAIHRIFERYNIGKVYGQWEIAGKMYADLGAAPNDEREKADACIACGTCEPKCPQNIPIIEQLRAAHSALS
ncbi:MAG: aldo/keto reductase [Chitinivibrionales bacterium]|nr:aldo/keto reductase [Chitinivibrionales bacterium]